MVTLNEIFDITSEKNCTFDEKIEYVEMKSKKIFKFTSIKGPKIKKISITDAILELSTLCPFALSKESKKALPSLEKVLISRSQIKGFESHEDCGDNELSKPLTKPDYDPRGVEVTITMYFLYCNDEKN